MSDGTSSAQSDKQVELVGDAYVKRAVSWPDVARARAQAGFGIVTAIISALVATGLLADLPHAGLWIQVLAVIALVPWFAVAAFFMQALTIRPPTIHGRGDFTLSDTEFVRFILGESRNELLGVEKLLNRARRTTYAALAVTLCSIVALLGVADKAQREGANVAVSDEVLATLRSACGKELPVRDGAILGDVVLSTLDDPLIRVDVGEHICGNGSVEIPRNSIKAIALHGNCSVKNFRASFGPPMQTIVYGQGSHALTSTTVTVAPGISSDTQKDCTWFIANP